MNKRAMMLYVFIAVFALSGFSGLIYESIWSHYLKLFLGHASYAQVLVLAIFMGGMAIGSALAAKLSNRLTNLILWYGIVEGIIGLFGLTFHSIFVAVQSAAFEDIFPNLEAAWLVHTVKWMIGSFMILPQSILLGATFPLLTAGLIRRFPGNSGKTLATLYFINSFGAAIGVLTNAFVLIPNIGLPGAVLTAGLLNVFLAIAVYFLSKGDHYPSTKPASGADSSAISNSVYSYLLVIAAFTGLASFMYEIGWIRMLTMVLGGSTHSFEIMLSAFILGLAIGGFWIRKKIDAFDNPLLVLGIIQLVMGTFAALTIPLYNQTYELMGLFMEALKNSDSGYLLYTIISYGISLLIMLPATICAGTTLPLATFIMLKGTSGDSAIGKIYAWNTVGSILGVVLAIQVVMPLFGLKWVIGIGALVDVMLGLFILHRARISLKYHKPQVALVSMSLVIILAIPFLGLDTQKMASGVYRYGLAAISLGDIVFHKDGKASTVAVRVVGNKAALLNNGKPDAALKLNSDIEEARVDRTGDEPTMVLAGTLPYVYRPNATNVANIGLGSGLTAHVLLHNKELERLDTIEIEQAVYEAAEYFRPRVENLYSDPRSRVIIEDAKTYFATSGHKYDVIVSEPSNPWVSGVSGLFSTEFYHEVKRYLKPNGILVQWVQMYEISPELVATVYLALKENFADIHMYQIADGDVAIVAGMAGLEADYSAPFKHSGLREELDQVNIINESDLAFRKLAGKNELDIVFTSLAGNPNSDYFPVLDIGAAKTRFKKTDAKAIYTFYKTKALKRVSNETEIAFDDITEAPTIEATRLVRQRKQFHKLFNEYSVSGNVPLITATLAEGTAKSLVEIITYCKSDKDDRSADEISSQLMNFTHWVYEFSTSEDMKSLFDQFESCRSRLSEEGLLWLDAHVAWLGGDLPKVKELTKNYLEKKDIFATPVDKHLLILNISSHIMKGTGSDIYQYHKKISPAISKDLELLGLLNLFDPSLVTKQ
ncbi:MAG: spermidine synthase [Candidatus Thiodiazotropha sp. (ex Ctena orbiculata)]|nr:spermidine synthase [Candidatus Thiodiazotropha taylori]MBT3033667.1 spermidine synthase [Candidatus Thiodiazotropha taylori]